MSFNLDFVTISTRTELCNALSDLNKYVVRIVQESRDVIFSRNHFLIDELEP